MEVPNAGGEVKCSCSSWKLATSDAKSFKLNSVASLSHWASTFLVCSTSHGFVIDSWSLFAQLTLLVGWSLTSLYSTNTAISETSSRFYPTPCILCFMMLFIQPGTPKKPFPVGRLQPHVIDVHWTLSIPNCISIGSIVFAQHTVKYSGRESLYFTVCIKTWLMRLKKLIVLQP